MYIHIYVCITLISIESLITHFQYAYVYIRIDIDNFVCFYIDLLYVYTHTRSH